MKTRTGKLFCILGAALVLTALGLLLNTEHSPISGKYPLINHSIVIDQWAPRETVISVRQDGRDLGAVEGELGGNNVKFNLAHTRAVFRANHHDHRSNTYTSDLYLVEKEKIIWIADQTLDYVIAPEGDGLAYMREGEPGSKQLADLYLYRNGRNQLIAENVGYPRTTEGFQISPDGSCVSWMSLATAYFYDGKAVAELGTGLTCKGISEGGSLVYLRQGSNDHIFVQQGGDNGSRVDLGEGMFYCFNRDLTEAVCTNRSNTGDGLEYQPFILRNGSQKHLLEHRIFSPTLPMGTQAEGQIMGISSFANTYYQDPQWYVIYLDNRFCTRRLPEQKKVIQSTLCADGKTLVYSTKDGIYRLDGSSPRVKPQKLLNKEVRGYWVMGSGESVYYTDRESKLYYRHGKLPPIRISERADTVISGVRNDTLIYTVTGAYAMRGDSCLGSPTACQVYAVKDGRSRLLTVVERGQYVDWRPIYRDLQRGIYGGVMRYLDENNKIQCSFFDEPWNYDKLHTWGR